MKTERRQLSHSQNFLRSSKLVAELIEASSIDKSDTVYEMGPGKGIITRQLSERCAKVIAIEYDRRLFEKLKQIFAGEKKIEIAFGDFLKTKLPLHGSYKVFSNIPFDLTAEVLVKLTLAPNPPSDSYLIIQEEAAKKYAGSPYGEERFRSLILKPKFEFAIIHRFRRIDFSPVPGVDIVLLRIKRRDSFLFDKSEQTRFNDFVAYAFSQSGADLNERMKKVFSREQFKHLGRDLKFNFSARPGDPDFDQWLGLFRYFLQGVSADKQAIVRGSCARLVSQQRKLDKIHRTRKD